ncbi:MAG TPA: hypothetical protein VEL82_05715 [Thermoplasmata archaeon]|nr:hypothetical protein [Thermoplasmata archaeon]
MAQVLTDPASLPVGCHALGIYSDASEQESHAVRFLSGAPAGTPAVYFVHDPKIAEQYNARLAHDVPDRAGSVVSLGHEQVEPDHGKLRPAKEVREYISHHPQGMTAGGDTLSMYLAPDTADAHLEYESWFDDQPRDASRFICPYDIRSIPIDAAPEILSDLGRHHSHVVLSSSPEPAVRLLQLFIFGTRADVPDRLGADLRWAQEKEYLRPAGARDSLELTDAGREIVREWSDRTTVDW